jgi:hypothetical protein
MVSVMFVEALIDLDVSVPTIVSVYVPFAALELDELPVEFPEVLEPLELPPQPDAANPIATRRRVPVNMRMHRLRRRRPSSPAPSKPAMARPAGACELEGGGALSLRTPELAFTSLRLPLPPAVVEVLEQSDDDV